MEQLLLWITPALVLGLFAWSHFMFRDLKENMSDLKTHMNTLFDDLKTHMNTLFDDLKTHMNTLFAETNGRFAETNGRFDSLANDMNRRFDEVNRELADNRERMAKLEVSLDGFLAGRRDRDAA